MFKKDLVVPLCVPVTSTPAVESKEEIKLDLFEQGMKFLNDYRNKVSIPRWRLPFALSVDESGLELALKCFEKIPDLGKSFDKLSDTLLEEMIERFAHRPSGWFDKRLDQAFAQLILRAAEQGSTQACYALGLAYVYHYNFKNDNPFKETENRNEIEIIHWLKLAADKGHVKAAYELGYHFENYSPPQQLALALEYYEVAAKQGHEKALECLKPYAPPPEEKMYFLRMGLSKMELCLAKPVLLESDIEEIVSHFELREPPGSPFSLESYSGCFPVKKHASLLGIEAKVAQFIVAAAERGSAVAQYHLANAAYACRVDLFVNPSFSQCSEKRSIRANEWYEKSAAQGYADAMYKLGEQGRDFPTQARWFKQAAERNHALAQIQLAWIYDNNCPGVGRNVFAAFYWWQKLAEKGNERAFIPLVEKYIRGSGTAINYVRAMRYLCKSLFFGRSVEGQLTSEIESLFRLKLADITPESLSYDQACLLFYATVALVLMEERGDAIEAKVAKQKENIEFVYGGYETNLYSEIVATHMDSIKNKFKRISVEHKDFFHSMLRQHPEYVEKIAAHFPEEKSEIMSLGASSGDPLPIEKYAHCLHTLIEKLYAFEEKPESIAARHATDLMSRLLPFGDVLAKPLAIVDANTSLRELLACLERQKSVLTPDLMSSMCRVLSGRVSLPILAVLEESIAMIKASIPAVAPSVEYKR